MASLIDVNGITKAYGARPLFSSIRFSIEEGARIGLIGPNGAGKSTLLQILAGLTDADEGQIIRRKGLRVALLEQQPQLKLEADIRTNILEAVQDRSDSSAIQYVDELISRFGLDSLPAGATVSSLSGGWRKRVALAREVAKQPDLLLLDEPTNHLDIESILWLEEFLAQASFAIFAITHDRLFLQNVAARILELDRRNPLGLLSVDGDYATYLERKENLLTAQEQQEQSFKNRLRRETAWLRRGAKARSTKQKARIDRAADLKEQVEELKGRNVSRVARLGFQAAETTKARLIEAKGISKSYNGQSLFSKFNLLLHSKSRIGLLGRNGCGKSTLIRVLLGEETPETGTVKHSDQLSVAYFTQTRDTLDPKLSMLEVLAPDGDHVFFGGKFVHVRGYLDRFLFSADQMELPCGRLSGGEQSRLLIAKLMLTQANLLVLDEPTNDLDIATLDVLQDCLTEFTGAVLLVSHDRYFLDQVCSELLAFQSDQQGNRTITTFASLEQWEQALAAQLKAEGVLPTAAEAQEPRPQKRSSRLTYNEQRELELLPKAIEKMEAELQQLQRKLENPTIENQARERQQILLALAEKELERERLYERWSALER